MADGVCCRPRSNATPSTRRSRSAIRPLPALAPFDGISRTGTTDTGTTDTNKFRRKSLPFGDQPLYSPRMSVAPFEQIGPYRIGRRLGSGGMGEVLLAQKIGFAGMK